MVLHPPPHLRSPPGGSASLHTHWTSVKHVPDHSCHWRFVVAILGRQARRPVTDVRKSRPPEARSVDFGPEARFLRTGRSPGGTLPYRTPNRPEGIPARPADTQVEHHPDNSDPYRGRPVLFLPPDAHLPGPGPS